MSAICGLPNPTDPLRAQKDLSTMIGALKHRGPDGKQSWHTGPVGLGNLHCATGDHEHDLQDRALIERRGPLVITAAARLDNRAELLAALALDGQPARRPPSDAKIILRAYERWGEECPTRLLGDFAFAVWDSQRGLLFCARDHLGLKPLFYVHSRNCFAFATETKALLVLPFVARILNKTRIADYLMQMHEDVESSFYEGIQRLPPASTLAIGLKNRPQKTKYWRLHPQRESSFASDAEYGEQFRALFLEAVKCRTRDASPLGSMLSGGFDSSSITCLAKLVLAETDQARLKTFSLTFDELPESDERRFIEAVVETGGIEPHYVAGDQIDPLQGLDQMLWHLDEPFITPNLFLYWELYRSAERAGARVMLDGFFGDNAVSHGTRYFVELAVKGRWLELARQFRAIARALGESRSRVYPYLLRDHVLRPLVGEATELALTTVCNPVLPRFPQSRFVNRDFAREVRWMERARTFGQDTDRTPVTAKAEHMMDVQSGNLPHAAEVLDKAGAAFSLSVRLPFADRRLLEYCLTVPASQKLKDGWTRAYARRGLHDDLPEKIRQRYGKRYLGGALHRGLLTLARDDATSLVMERLPIAEPYVDVKATQTAFQKLLATSADENSLNTLAAIWPAMILTRWLERERDSQCAGNGTAAGSSS